MLKRLLAHLILIPVLIFISPFVVLVCLGDLLIRVIFWAADTAWCGEGE